jgi:hypothetical protein
MKKIWKYLFILLSTSSSAQITLDNTVTSISSIGQDFYTVQISSTETKYLFEDTVTNTFSLYNMDFTPFLLNIAVPEPFSNWTFQVLYVTRSLFDCDTSNIEYVYEASTSEIHTFYIMRTDGTQLFSKDSVNGPFCLGGGCLSLSDDIRPIRNTSAGAKLFLQRHRAGQVSIFIYSLCGTLPEDVFDLTLQSQSYVTVFPNPSSTTLTFKINLPDNMNEYELVIVDNSAREVKREKVNSLNINYSIDMRNYSSGTYYYSLCTKNKSYQSGKFILTK